MATLDTTVSLRVCKRCGSPKKAHDCKACDGPRKQAWAEANRTRVREQKLAYEGKFPERVLASKLKYSRTERGKAMHRKNNVDHRDDINARNRELFSMRHEPLIARLVRRKEREAAADGEFTKEDEIIMLQTQRGECAGCNIVLTTNYHVDHILALVHGGSHWPSNRQILCVTCNHRKGVKTPEQWEEMKPTLSELSPWKELFPA